MLDGDTPTVEPGNGLGFEHVEAFVGGATTADGRGRRFERVCAYLLRHAPEYGLADVWLWREWPDRDASGFGFQDLGIDLVGRTRSGELWAIQAKFRTDPAQALTWEELATFVGHSARPDLFAYRLVMTNIWAVPSRFERATAGQAIGWLGRADLLALGLDWRPFLEPEAAPASARKAPRPHQDAAVRDVVAHLESHGRAQLIMACGTGKTLTALWIAEARGDQRVLVLVPSLSLLRQFRREWLESADPALPFADLCVCSDVTVAGGHARGMADDLQERAADLGVPVTTDAETIATFLRGDGRRVVFATYQSSPRIAEAMADPAVPLFDLAIADEAHRLAAPTERAFATVLDDSKIRAGRRLFATATPRYVAPQVKRRAEEEDVEVVSMDDPEVFGAVAHHLSFGQAIAQDLLSDYRVVVLATSDAATANMVASRRLVRPGDGEPVTDAATLATLASVAHAVDELGLRRLISFHRTVERARSFARAATSIAVDPQRHSDHVFEASYVSGEMTAGERAQKLDRLRRADGCAVLLANARCLTEGVDVPALDGIVFVDPRWSPIDTVQAVGRVIRKSEGKNLGTIVIPVLVPDDIEPDGVLESSSFEVVWSVVRAVRSHDERLAEVLSAARTELGRTGRPSRFAFLDDHFGVLDLPVALDPAAFAEAIKLRIVDAGSFGFDEGLGHLLAYVEEHGDARVPASHVTLTGRNLGSWVAVQRAEFRSGRLGAERSSRLEQLPGWSWDPVEDDFQTGLRALCAFAAECGHLRIPNRLRDFRGLDLASWCRNRRAAYQRGELGLERVAALESIPGWSWDPRESNFDAGLQHLREFVARHGDARVPAQERATDGFYLGRWLAHQRALRREGKLSAARVAALGKLPGWTWDPREDDFQQGIAALQRYVRDRGSAHVPKDHVMADGTQLGSWVSVQRRKHRQRLLDTEQSDLLEALPGWTWDPHADAFDRGVASLQRFVTQHGHADVPQAYCDPDGLRLGAWVSNQRQLHKAGKLSAARVAALEPAPGWSWQAEEDFDIGFRHLSDFVTQHGSARVPVGYRAADGWAVGAWVARRRAEWHAGQLPEDMATLLDSMPGWTWDPFEDDFGAGLTALRAFVADHGHARVPVSYVTPSGMRLGRWEQHQRTQWRRGELSPERIAALESVPGWGLDARAHHSVVQAAARER